jgi:hypothetical protein
MHERMDPTARDVQVLPHLQGFPEEIKRFSNLVKQAHPKGKSAIDLILQRPGARPTFLHRVCAAVADGEDIVTTVEAARILAVPPGELIRRLDAGELPAPVFHDGRRAIWPRIALLASAATSGER